MGDYFLHHADYFGQSNRSLGNQNRDVNILAWYTYFNVMHDQGIVFSVYGLIICFIDSVIYNCVILLIHLYLQ